MNPTDQHAVILFAHGSRDPLWHKPMEAVAAQMALNSPASLVRCAYLELSQPDLPAACQELVEAGVRAITIVPMFLGVGRHAREDLPMLAAQLRAAYPQVAIAVKPAVGEDQRLIQLLAAISAE